MSQPHVPRVSRPLRRVRFLASASTLRRWLPFLLLMPLTAYATGAPGLPFVDGMCKVLSFMSDTVAAVMLALAIAGYSLMHAFGEARDGVMGTVLRIGFGGSIAIGAASAVTWLFSKTACPARSSTTKMVMDLITAWMV
jgi:TrbC/VIRB2 pilin